VRRGAFGVRVRHHPPGSLQPLRMIQKNWPSGPEIEVSNGILGALLKTEYGRLAAKMERVDLKRGAVVYRANQKIGHVYFPEDAVVAMVDTLDDGRTVEVGLVGHEGMVGINVFLGTIATPDKAVVQLPGAALRMSSRDLRKAVRFGSPLQRVLLQYTQVALAVISQSVACSQHHRVEQRLARWILTMDQYAHPHELVMSHTSMAAMLGARRSGISIAASHLQALGLMRYRRGHIVVLDRKGLEEQSCECYRFIEKQHRSLLRQVPRLLSPEAS
jgi:CRP-like cAMP-binding protein